MIKTAIVEILKERIRIMIETQDNWDYGIEQCWKKYIDVLIADIEKTIHYFLHECSDEEFYWLSEVFEELIEKSQSNELIAAFRTRLSKVTPENYHQEKFETEFMRKRIDYYEYVRDINKEIDYAESRINDDTDAL